MSIRTSWLETALLETDATSEGVDRRLEGPKRVPQPRAREAGRIGHALSCPPARVTHRADLAERVHHRHRLAKLRARPKAHRGPAIEGVDLDRDVPVRVPRQRGPVPAHVLRLPEKAVAVKSQNLTHCPCRQWR